MYDMDPNSNVNYRRKIGPTSPIESLVSFLEEFLKNFAIVWKYLARILKKTEEFFLEFRPEFHQMASTIGYTEFFLLLWIWQVKIG